VKNDAKKTVAKGRVWIGTSNIVVPGPKKDFPENFQSSSRLTYYGSLFNTLEVNSSFYKVPLPATFERWSAEVPGEFKFTVKLWKQVTHVKYLKYRLQDIDFFMKSVNQLSPSKKGCLLVQFPASITAEYSKKLERILQRIQQRDPERQWSKCIEFRHKSWYNDKAYALLNKYNAALVLHDMPASRIKTTQSPVVFVNLRFHGIKGDYRGSYPPELLQQYAGKIKKWTKQGKDVYAYFNNTMGDAFGNARLLQEYCRDIK
jgi:uncharacterized protein YecE (DUF72 family)